MKCTTEPYAVGLFGISFDGGESGVSSRTVVPVSVSCLNFDGADPLACGLVGFVPAIEVPKLFKDKCNKVYLRAKTFVLQRCIAAVLDELEAVACDGFVVDLGGQRTRVHPWLAAVRVDSKERKTYFGLKSDRSCAICRFRKGWSALRRGSSHTVNHVQRLWNLAIDTPRPHGGGPEIRALKQAQRRAREQLQRHGFHRTLRCTLLDHAHSILIRDPSVPAPSQPLFANTIYVDLLHWLLNCCDYGFAAIQGVMTKEMLLECDLNTHRLPTFRNPDGSGVRKFYQVSSQTYLTAARRMSLMFVWTHALGTGALMLPAECRRPALCALSAIQTIILVTQGSRSYSHRDVACTCT